MALIKSQLVLVDGMTAPLRSIFAETNLALNSFESMQTASGRAVDTRSFARRRVKTCWDGRAASRNARNAINRRAAEDP